MARAHRAARLELGEGELYLSRADADLLHRVAAALARNDRRARCLRQAIQCTSQPPVTFEAWLPFRKTRH
jgi:hypothetical protein